MNELTNTCEKKDLNDNNIVQFIEVDSSSLVGDHNVYKSL